MPDIDPAALSRPSISSSTPILPPKSLSIVPPPSSAATKTMSTKTERIPPRIDLEPLYVALKKEVGERWREYSEAVGRFVMGMLLPAIYCVFAFDLPWTCETRNYYGKS